MLSGKNVTTIDAQLRKSGDTAAIRIVVCLGNLEVHNEMLRSRQKEGMTKSRRLILSNSCCFRHSGPGPRPSGGPGVRFSDQTLGASPRTHGSFYRSTSRIWLAFPPLRFESHPRCAQAAGAKTEERITTASLSWTRFQLVECVLQLLKLLSSLAELAFGSQTLIVGKVLGGFRD
jgi:hypothetical protein